jgi:hypothetical protein
MPTALPSCRKVRLAADASDSSSEPTPRTTPTAIMENDAATPKPMRIDAG